VKNHHHNEEVGQSLHKLVKEMGGVESIAKKLHSDLVVSPFLTHLLRMELKAHPATSSVAAESK
jgi:hypothetical protein